MAQEITRKAQELSLDNNVKTQLKRVPFGKEMLKEFSFSPQWRNLNNGTISTPSKIAS